MAYLRLPLAYANLTKERIAFLLLVESKLNTPSISKLSFMQLGVRIKIGLDLTLNRLIVKICYNG